jgi:hypothetical protein
MTDAAADTCELWGRRLTGPSLRVQTAGPGECFHPHARPHADERIGDEAEALADCSGERPLPSGG